MGEPFNKYKEDAEDLELKKYNIQTFNYVALPKTSSFVLH